MRYKLISFDLDGTLVNTAVEIAEAANRSLEDLGLARCPLAQIERLIGAGTHHLMTRLLADVLGGPQAVTPATLRRALERIEHHYTDTAGTVGQPYPGCVDTLLELRRRGIALACLTNKEKRFADRVLNATKLSSYFSLVIGGDTLAVKKPDPETIRYLERHFQADRTAVAHIGDSNVDISTARNAGVAAWAVPYGYNAGVPIEMSKPDQVFAQLTDILGYLDAPRSAPKLSQSAAKPRNSVRRLRAVLWDVDGTLAETERDGHRVAFNEAFAAARLSWHWSAERYGQLLEVTGGFERLLADMPNHADAPSEPTERVALAKRLHHAKNAAYANIVQSGSIGFRPGVRALLDELQQSEILTGLVSTTSRSNVDALLKVNLSVNWRERFALVICGEDVEHKKPDPQAYRLALKTLQLSPDDVLAIEDSGPGMAAALGARIPVVLTRSFYFPAVDGAPACASVPDLEAIDLNTLVQWHQQANFT